MEVCLGKQTPDPNIAKKHKQTTRPAGQTHVWRMARLATQPACRVVGQISKKGRFALGVGDPFGQVVGLILSSFEGFCITPWDYTLEK